MDEITAWLRQQFDARLAQLDEDERVARAATERQPYDEWDAAGAEGYDDVSLSHWEVVGIARAVHSPAARSIAEHIARWDPARVLAEVELERAEVDVKRHLLDDLAALQGDPVNGLVITRMIRLLAQPYAGQPGWREQWAI